jgi:hypothetical protein
MNEWTALTWQQCQRILERTAMTRGGRRRFFHFFAFASASQKKSAKAREKKSAKKAKAPSAKEEKRKFALFPPSHTGSLVPEPKDARQGESKGLE